MFKVELHSVESLSQWVFGGYKTANLGSWYSRSDAITAANSHAQILETYQEFDSGQFAMALRLWSPEIGDNLEIPIGPDGKYQVEITRVK